MPIYTPIETTILEVREDEKIENGISRYDQNENMSEIRAKTIRKKVTWSNTHANYQSRMRKGKEH